MRRAAAFVAALLLLGACSGGRSEQAGCSSNQTLTVLAASSLTEAFQRIGRGFEDLHPCTTVDFSFGPSDGLAAQIREGAPADVFASASASWMDAVSTDPGVRDRVEFASNRLIVITPSDDPAGITSVANLANPGVKLVLAAPGVPAGDYAREMLDRAHIGRAAEANVVSNEEDDKAVVQKVVLGEADAGVVYRTDITSTVADEVRTIPIPDAVNVVATYPIAIVSGSSHVELARAFVSYVTGSAQPTLASFGFLPAS